ARIDMRSNADVTGPLQGKRTVLRINRRDLGLVGNDSNIDGRRNGHARNSLPTEMGESTVGLGHFVHLFLLLHDGAGIVVGVDDFGGNGFAHWGALAAGGGEDDPPESE